ncbi:serine protease [Deinococcus irradiatisoli]|uniref:Serine protease n=1 Tax=Deinococcus irradiatisoli TaxID=2202254 RepID=A0A2Z3JIK3_9DEIO|nr:S1C family serine protease [Deinococcus irradiatisoli]AWN23826.1 serine protease [Deinococcus irradiatisoli]
MKFSPWPAALLLIACAAYFVPQSGSGSVGSAAPPALSDTLAHTERSLFTKSRPATVRIEQLGPSGNGGLQGGLGTGFLISGDGQVMTAYHVIDGAQLIRVKTLSGQTYRARVTAFDNAADVALLKIDTRKALPFLKLAARPARVGEGVLAIGNSGGDFLQARTGTLLRLGARAGQADFPQNTFEMNAPLAPGDSGGPILNAQGEVMGVVSYVRVNDAGQTLTSYAVPVMERGSLVQALEAGEKRDVPAVGLRFDGQHDGLTTPSGGVVAEVIKGGPAAMAGVRGASYDAQDQLTALGDTITAVDGVRTRSSNDVIFELRRRQVGDSVTLSLSRGGKSRQVRVHLVAKGSINYNQ